MPLARLTLTTLIAVALALVMAPADATSGPPLTLSTATLAAATHCDAGATAHHHTVLLVHGTGATDDEAWSWNYEKALPTAGFGVCTVTLPDRALGDFTVAAQYAVYAARQAFRVSGQKIGILGHSQGGLMAVWIAKFWPDVAQHATDVIGLAANVRGTQLANTLCTAGSCSPIAWQMRRGSHVTNAATNAPLPTTTSFTSIGSQTDEVVYPQPTVSSFPGVDAVMVQSICPERVVDHGLLLSDAVAYQLVLDALTHDGPANTVRIDRSACLQQTMPGADPTQSAGFANTIVALSVGLLDARTYTDHEAPVPAYAAPYAG